MRYPYEDGHAVSMIVYQLRPAMTPGFVMLRGGYPYLFGDKLTNWEAWGA